MVSVPGTDHHGCTLLPNGVRTILPEDQQARAGHVFFVPHFLDALLHIRATVLRRSTHLQILQLTVEFQVQAGAYMLCWRRCILHVAYICQKIGALA